MTARTSEAPRLERSLNVWQVTASGVGIVIGAGIYVLIGEAAKEAGAALWLSFIIAAALSALTGLSYAELAGMFPSAGAEYEFARRAFNEFVAFLIGWMMVLALFIAAAAVSLGFALYLGHFVDVPNRLAAIGLLLCLTAIIIIGIRRSIWLSVLLAALQVGGLLVVSSRDFLTLAIGRSWKARALSACFQVPLWSSSPSSASMRSSRCRRKRRTQRV